MQHGHCNQIPIPLYINELFFYLSPNGNGRFIGPQHADGKTINELDVCQVQDDEVFCIQVIIRDESHLHGKYQI